MAKITVGGSGRIHSGGKISQEIQDFNRANHNLSKIVRDTIAPGVCVPFYTKRALPGDTFDIEDIEVAIYTDPTERAMYGSYRLYTEFYFVPTRLYQAWLHNNKEYIGEDMSQVKLPIMDIKANGIDWNLTEQAEIQQIHPSSLLAHLGVRTLGQHIEGYSPETPEVRAMFNAETLLGYYDIGKNYYMNRQEKEGWMVDYSETQTSYRVSLFIYENSQPKVNKLIPYQLSVPTERSFYNLPSDYTDQATIIIDGQDLGYVNGTKISLTSFRSWTSEMTDTIELTNMPVATFDDDEKCIHIQITLTQAEVDLLKGQSSSAKTFSEISVKEQAGRIGANLTKFPITNIDDMREDILAAIKENTAFKINELTYAPYGLNFKKQKKTVQTKENPNDDIERDCITSYYPMQGLYLCTYMSDKFNNWLDSEYIDKLSGVGGRGLLDVTEGLNLNVLQLAMKIYNQTAKIAISNRSYEDWMLVVHGQHNAAKTEIPRYEGGYSQDIYFQELRSTAETEGMPTGSIVANAVMGGNKSGGKIVIRCEEAGNIIGIVRIVPRLIYSQGNNPDLDLMTMDDLHQPDLDGIGYQDLLTERFAAIDTRRDDNGIPQYRSIGKQPAYIDYMTDIDEAYGDFAIENNKMTMTLNRRYQYDNQGNISDATTYIDPQKFNYVWAGTARNDQHFDTQIGMKITARRKVSTRQMPQFNI